ncbi:MAG: discoidin domain-containing protein, partial [Dehalococcoidia bacterium]|nr:discoidin domain-containing protein [Dehalococcoidia bacterium]
MGQSGADVRPLTEIMVSGPDFANLQPNSVTVALDTSIPVACSVVYGTTNEYGQIAVDSDMAGSGHENHHPVMSRLEPDTTYYLRFQGTGPDGTLYRSEEYTVRTPAASDVKAPEKPGGKNLALPVNGGSISAVSGNFGGGSNGSSFGANNAIDGNMGTEWSSQGDGDDAWIEIELAEQAEVRAVGFRTRTMGDSAQIFTFRIVADGRAISGPFELPASNGIYYFPVT